MLAENSSDCVEEGHSECNEDRHPEGHGADLANAVLPVEDVPEIDKDGTHYDGGRSKKMMNLEALPVNDVVADGDEHRCDAKYRYDDPRVDSR